jgi:NAD(P)-dependent dehydrogenase (short-subunit alcohol dehydrogenase family)
VESIEGRVALVAGGGRCIGRSVAPALARAGAHVAVAARTVAEIEAVAAEVAALRC